MSKRIVRITAIIAVVIVVIIALNVLAPSILDTLLAMHGLS